MQVPARRLRFGALAAAAVVAAPVIWNAASNSAGAAGGIPANKVAASGSSVEVFTPSTTVELLRETVKINNPTDLILTASAECSIISQVKTTGNDTSTQRASVRVWVEINGEEVPVAADKPGPGLGHVTFCDRVHQQESRLYNEDDTADTTEDSDDFVRTYLSTRTANAFSWMALNVGSTYLSAENNIYEVVLYAELTANSTPASCMPGPDNAPAPATHVGECSAAAVGNRTLVLEPVKSAHRESVTELA
jgi:hypothetical protein